MISFYQSGIKGWCITSYRHEHLLFSICRAWQRNLNIGSQLQAELNYSIEAHAKVFIKCKFDVSRRENWNLYWPHPIISTYIMSQFDNFSLSLTFQTVNSHFIYFLFIFFQIYIWIVTVFRLSIMKLCCFFLFIHYHAKVIYKPTVIKTAILNDRLSENNQFSSC